jgi:hypothetical protein
MNSRIDLFISFVSVINPNSSSDIYKFILEADKILSSTYTDHEIVLIATSHDYPKMQFMDDMLKKIPCIRVINTITKLNEDTFLAMSLDNAIGDFIVICDMETDAADLIPEVINIAKNGHDIVVGVDSKPKKSIFYKIFEPFASSILRVVSNYNISFNITSFKCISRKMANALISTKRTYTHMGFWIFQIGASIVFFNYEPKMRKKKTLKDGVGKLVYILVYNSVKPLRIFSLLGLAVSFSMFIFSVYVIISKFLRTDIVEGWSSIAAMSSILFSILFLVLSLFCEYLIMLLEERYEFDIYTILSEKSSSVMFDSKRVNVYSESIILSDKNNESRNSNSCS